MVWGKFGQLIHTVSPAVIKLAVDSFTPIIDTDEVILQLILITGACR